MATAATDEIGGTLAALGTLALGAGLANIKMDKVSKLAQKLLIGGGTAAIASGALTIGAGRVIDGLAEKLSFG